jgi:hypothetical protein
MLVYAARRRRPIVHASNVVQCDGPNSPHAFDIIPLQPRNGTLDAKCPICKGHGQWNTEIDLVSFRCKRAVCDYCKGAGWIETGNDPVGHADIVMSPNGYPQWVVAFEPRQDPEHAVADPDAPLSPEQFDR